jgi:hypothetical protein
MTTCTKTGNQKLINFQYFNKKKIRVFPGFQIKFTQFYFVTGSCASLQALIPSASSTT